MSALYQHLAALPARRGKRYRARLVSQVLEVGSAVLFSAGHAADEALVMAYRSSIPAAIPAPDGDGEAMRLALVIQDSGATAPLCARLQALPEGQGKQGRARLLALAIQAGVSVLYRGLVLGAVDPSATTLPALPKPDAVPAAPATPPLGGEVLDFMDNLSMEGLD